MTFCYQNQWDNCCYSPCNYGSVYSYRTYDCGSPCSYRRSWDCYQDCYPSYSSRCYSPCSTRYTSRYSYGSCYPCYSC
uniref:Uncharacterized protein n=1 Tax=Pavo cristatus TaxID=9049 RepID=A0A8C9FII0_PAVCR